LLDKLQAARPEVEIETIEVLQHPRRALRDGVFMIPALMVGERRWYHAPPLHELLAALDADTGPQVSQPSQVWPLS
jgi:hypothetical protein